MKRRRSDATKLRYLRAEMKAVQGELAARRWVGWKGFNILYNLLQIGYTPRQDKRSTEYFEVVRECDGICMWDSVRKV